MALSIPVAAKVSLVERMADVEHRLAFSTSEKLQVGALVAAFVRARETIAAAAK
jgi:replication factor C subunit 3/5